LAFFSGKEKPVKKAYLFLGIVAVILSGTGFYFTLVGDWRASSSWWNLAAVCLWVAWIINAITRKP